MSVVVVATIVPVAEHRDEVIAAIKETIGQVHGEDGCELYTLNEAPDRLIMIEKWANAQALAAHSNGRNLAALNPKLVGKVARPPEIFVLQQVPAGDPVKGQL
ncbi:MAG TPA: antibiotic biosynthesis monooxygenase [Streptosporangiaceae bacterium]|nr:antibiotic biosynthesis monooxygenase [Streptosporangiaceae bacterium]